MVSEFSEYWGSIHKFVIAERVMLRWILLIGILVFELIEITARYEVPTIFSPRLAFATEIDWVAGLFYFSKQLWRLGLWSIGACFLILIPRFRTILRDLKTQSSGHRWSVWLILHLLALTAFLGLTALIFEKPTNPAYLSAPWGAGWLGLASTTLLLWLLALAPGRFWMRLVRREYAALLMGALLGLGAWRLLGMLVRQEAPLAQQELWSSLSEPTLRFVHTLLGWIYVDLVYQPERLLIGTGAFPVDISYACSGIEGMALMAIFLTVYLGLFRKELRFPQAFWLFPLGIAAIWVANSLRILLLIVIGTSVSPAIAVTGFHAEAGWIAFILVALGAIALSHRLRFFSVIKPGVSIARSNPSLAAALLAPLIGLMGTAMVTAAFSTGFDRLYPLHVLVAAALLWHYRQTYRGLGWSGSWPAVGIGAVVFVLWLLMEPRVDESHTAVAQGLSALTTGTAAVWLAFRVVGSVFIVPVVEELAFRGYLLRKLMAPDWEQARLRFTGLSFMGSSLLFGLLHDRWLAGTVAGMVYALALYRRGQLGEAVLAHLTTNALIAVWVLELGRWSLWS